MDATSNNDGEQYFLWFSDFHFDPHYSTSQAVISKYYPDADCNNEGASSIGSYGCDSPRSLVRAALEHAIKITAARTPSSPAFVIVSGDSIRHGVDQLFSRNRNNHTSAANAAVEQAARAPWHLQAMDTVGDILNDLISMVQLAFPQAEIIVSVGNNDVVPDYYLQLQNEDTPLGSHMTAADSGMVGVIFNALSNHANSATSEAQPNGSPNILTPNDEQTFLRGGYYSRNFHDGTLTVLSLNTVLYSGNFSPAPKNEDDPGWQFQWMRKMLSYCRENGTQAIIVGHLPPAVGSFRHTQIWKDIYIQK